MICQTPSLKLKIKFKIGFNSFCLGPFYSFNPTLFCLCNFKESKGIQGQKTKWDANRRLSLNATHYTLPQGFFVSNFLQAQKQSFKRFLKYGLIKELSLYGFFSTRLEDIHSEWSYDKKKQWIKMPLDGVCDILFHADAYQLKRPRLTPKQAILKQQTYASQLFVPIQFIYHPTQEIFIEWFLIANLPMMTNNGHFIVNGSARLVMNQIVRRPGMYLKEIQKPNGSIYVADFIAQRGTWLRLEIDGTKQRSLTKQIWAKMKKLPKCPVSLLLSDLGLDAPFFNHYLQSTGHRFKKDATFQKTFFEEKNRNGLLNDEDSIFNSKEEQLKKKILEKNKLFSRKLQTLSVLPSKEFAFQNTFLGRSQQMEAFLKLTMLTWPARLNSRSGYFRKKFTHAYNYTLGREGRLNLNKKLGLNFPLTHTTLTGEDVLLGCCHLIDFFNGSQKSSDIDDLENRKIRATGELIQNQISIGLLRLQEDIKIKLNQKSDLKRGFWNQRIKPLNKLNPHWHSLAFEKKRYFQDLISSFPINSALKDFFGTNPLSQFLDQTNPLAELTHKRRLSSLGEGGINRDTAGMAIRGIHPSHYGRICPIETPEGLNAGLVNSLTTYATLNEVGLIETPFYAVHKGIVLKDQNAYLFSSEQEKMFRLAPGDTNMDRFNRLPSTKVPVRKGKEIDQVFSNRIDFMAIAPWQMISVATSLIPFLEHDDGNRALMGSNMQRQAVPTLFSSKPIVGTGFEAKIIADGHYGLQSRSSGIVSYVDNQKIILYSAMHCQESLKKRMGYSRGLSDSETIFFNWHKKAFPPIAFDFKRFILSTGFEVVNQKKTYASKNCNKRSLFAGSTDFFKTNKQVLEFNTKQLHQLCHNPTENELNSLWIVFLWISKQLVQKRTNSCFPLLNQATLTLLKQIYNATLFRTYSLLLLNQLFWPISPAVFLKNKGLLRQKKRVGTAWLFFQSISSIEKGLLAQKFPIGSLSKTRSGELGGIVKFPLNFKQRQSLFFLRKKRIYSYKKLIFNPLNSFRIMLPFQSSISPLEMQINPSVFFKNPLFNHSDLMGIDQTKKPITLSKTPHSSLNQSLYALSETLFAMKKVTPIKKAKSSFYMSLFDKKVSEVDAPFLKPQNNDSLVGHSYRLETFSRSNQDTVLGHRPLVSPGQWVEKGDVLVDNRASCQGELAIGQNLLIGYMPWEGYNFEDAVLMNQRVISEDLFTTIHIERYEVLIKDTPYGREEITTRLPGKKENKNFLDPDGIIKLGRWVESGDILVGKVTPLGPVTVSAYEKLLYDIVDQPKETVRDTSLRVPHGVKGHVIHIERIELEPFQPAFSKKQNASKKDRFFLLQRHRFDLNALKKQKTKEKKAGFFFSSTNKHIFNKQRDYLGSSLNLFKDNTLVTKQRLMQSIFKTQRFGAWVTKKTNVVFQNPPSNLQNPLTKIQVYIAERRKIQIGDKIAGRHGNKGIISTILPREDMPYLPDGNPLDLVLNPLGVPSRMNVGQIFECLLGLAGSYLNQHYKIQPFDEMYGCEASRSLVYSKLYEARLKTNQSWLFNPNYPGKIRLFDGRTGDCFEQPVTVGKAYILKLIHLVDEKIHARSTGPYSVVTQQPLRGRSSQGGQRVGEMEVWAFEGFGAAYILQELLTIKSDDTKNRKNIVEAIVHNQPFQYGLPESFNLLMTELQCLCLKIVVGKVRKFPLIKPSVTLNAWSLKKAHPIGFKKSWPFK